MRRIGCVRRGAPHAADLSPGGRDGACSRGAQARGRAPEARGGDLQHVASVWAAARVESTDVRHVERHARRFGPATVRLVPRTPSSSRTHEVLERRGVFVEVHTQARRRGDRWRSQPTVTRAGPPREGGEWEAGGRRWEEARGCPKGVDGIGEPRLEAKATRRGSGIRPGSDLLSHSLTRAVPSALEGLTSEFGMGSGMAPPTLPPEDLEACDLLRGRKRPSYRRGACGLAERVLMLPTLESSDW